MTPNPSRGLLQPMSAAVATLPLTPRPVPTAAAPAAADQPGRFAPLLSLVRKLIDYGRQLAATLQQSTSAANLHDIAAGFGTYDLARIVASIIQGLHRATALQARLRHLETHPPPPPPSPAVSLAPRQDRPAAARRPAAPRPRLAADTTVHVPTPEEIAVKVGCQPIGEVIADICRDLGILPSHPFWRDLSLAIVQFGGRLGRLCVDITNRPWLDPATRQPVAIPAPASSRSQPPREPVATGPP